MALRRGAQQRLDFDLGGGRNINDASATQIDRVDVARYRIVPVDGVILNGQPQQIRRRLHILLGAGVNDASEIDVPGRLAFDDLHAPLFGQLVDIRFFRCHRSAGHGRTLCQFAKRVGEHQQSAFTHQELIDRVEVFVIQGWVNKHQHIDIVRHIFFQIKDISNVKTVL